MLRPGLNDSLKDAGNKARVVLRWLRDKKVPAHPVNFAVAYDYLSNKGGQVRQYLDQQEQKHGRLTGQIMLTCFDEFIDPQSPESMAITQLHQQAQETQLLLEKIGQDVLLASMQNSDDLDNFSSFLQSEAQELEVTDDKLALLDAIEVLHHQTNVARKKMRQLQWMFSNFTREISEVSQNLQQAKQQLLLDPLTQINNRRGLNKVFKELQSQEAAFLPAVLASVDLLDVQLQQGQQLDINKVIKLFANFLRQLVADKGVACRYNGDGFLLLLCQTNETEAKQLLAQLSKAVAQQNFSVNSGSEEANSGIRLAGVQIDLRIQMTHYHNDLTLEQWIERLQ